MAPSPDVQRQVLKSLRTDLENSYKNGFTYTPLAVDLQFVDPLVHTEARLPYELLWAPMWAAMKSIMDEDSLTFEVKSIEIVDADFSPFDAVAYPPHAGAPTLKRDASFAVHCIWETRGTGKFKFSAPMTAFTLLDQKPFFMSGQDVFRIDNKGQVFRHESGWDQNPVNLMAYLNPLAHFAPLEKVVPYFAAAIPARQIEPRAESDAAGPAMASG